MKVVKSLEESVLLIKGISETIRNKAKEQKRGFLAMLLDTLGASLLGNLLTGKGKYYQNEPKFNCVYSRNNLPKIKDKYM